MIHLFSFKTAMVCVGVCLFSFCAYLSNCHTSLIVLVFFVQVEAYIKEHIRPLCKSGVITAEQYRWAVAKTTEKVMKHHCKSKNANFLIKEGEKVKKLAEQYVETAQQNRKS